MRITSVAAVVLALGAAPAMAGDPVAPIHPGASATKARDIQEFALGTNIRAAMKRFTPTYAQGDQVQGRLGNIDLTFEVCPSGSIYMIDSTQHLGNFAVDKKFLDALDAKLFAKYGVGHGTPDNLGWSLVEPVRYSTGEVRNFTSNWMSALVESGNFDGVTLELKMLDFRICWAERSQANQKPRDAAIGALKF